MMPLVELVTPLKVSAPLLLIVPPLLKLLKMAGPFWVMTVLLNVVTPLNVLMAPARGSCVHPCRADMHWKWSPPEIFDIAALHWKK